MPVSCSLRIAHIYKNQTVQLPSNTAGWELFFLTFHEDTVQPTQLRKRRPLPL